MILGKPGAGKTTFLKYVAIQCNNGEFQADRVPIFITLKDFAEATNKPGLLEYISQQFSGCGVTATQVIDLFNYSRALVLLDGLDEVREEDNSRILRVIRDLSEQFYHNHLIMTCRIAAREYTFEKFTEVEVADFDDGQIQIFVTKWFQNKNLTKVDKFLRKLNENKPIKELATNPLLLTLLCLLFEEKGKFKDNRSELYEEGLELLLEKWDDSRDIERDQVYRNLSTNRKENLLSKIALTTFERNDYFFKQKQIQRYIVDYIRNLPNAQTDLEALNLNSKKVLKSIEAQHGLLIERARGIYSFTHLTFHEYFTAREIIFGTQPLEEALQNLVSHITEKRWREVFLLAVGMSSKADDLLVLMKQQIDKLLASDEKLQQFLIWVKEKSASVDVDYKPAAVRAFYLTLAVYHVYVFDFGLDLAHAIDQAVSYAHDLACAIDFCFDSGQTNNIISDLLISFAILGGHSIASSDDTFEPTIAQALFLTSLLGCDFALDRDCFLIPELNQLLQQPRDQLSKSGRQIETFKEWWQANGQAWTQQLRAAMIEHRNIGHDWQFNKQQKELLKQYHYANELLVKCLNSDCYMSREVRSQIEDTLLLPIAEIERRKGEFV